MRCPIRFCLTLLFLHVAGRVDAQETVKFSSALVLTNREVALTIEAPTSHHCRVEASSDLVQWTGLATFLGSASNQLVDSATAGSEKRFYRARTADTNVITGDHLSTADGEVTIHPVDHASLVLGWKGKTIYCDPVGATAQYQDLPRADLILVTHQHGDHFNASTINAIRGSNATILAPAVVYQALSATLKSVTQVLTNGASTNLLDLTVEAVPAYNANHPKGVGNGYVLSIGGKRIYVSGDTGDIAEMRALPNIDVAFVCMNLPFTMSVQQAASAVRAFQPKTVYVYHYRPYTTNDLNQFKALIGADLGIEVRLRNWY